MICYKMLSKVKKVEYIGHHNIPVYNRLRSSYWILNKEISKEIRKLIWRNKLPLISLIKRIKKWYAY